MLWWTLHQLKSKNSETQLQAIRKLRDTKDTRAVKALTEALRDSYWRVRQNSAWALGEIRDVSAGDALVEALSQTKVWTCGRLP